MRRSLVVLFMGLVALVGGVGTATSAVAEGYGYGSDCPTGYVCIYKGDIYDGTDYHPRVASYYKYGTYNLSGFYGLYTISNCQTGYAGVDGYSGYNGTGTKLFQSAVPRLCPAGFVQNMTPVNSIRLRPPA